MNDLPNSAYALAVVFLTDLCVGVWRQKFGRLHLNVGLIEPMGCYRWW